MDLIGAHKFSSHHRAAIERSAKCGCFYCKAVFAPSEITEWIDGSDTALCPRCNIDSVIGDADQRIDVNFLTSMREYWFVLK